MTITLRKPKITLWRVIFAVIMAAGLYATYLRIFYGFAGSTNLSDKFPWGLWIGFDVLCGVGLAAGGFTIVAMVHIFNIEHYKPILRPTIVTAFLGYLLVVAGLVFDLGRPDHLWHPLIMWNPHSVMFEVAWCVMLYNTVLFLEFLPIVLEKFHLHKALGWLKFVSVPLMIVGVILSTLHQSSLGTVFLIVPQKLDALWYSPVLPVFFYVSAIGVGLAMTIFESWHTSREFKRELELPILQGLARVLAVVLMVYLFARFLDLLHRGALPLVLVNRTETWLWWLEIALMATPMVLLFQSRWRQTPSRLYFCAVMYIFGFIANRLNVSITGQEAGSGVHYVPKWTEVAITLMLIAVGFAVFRFIAGYFPVFEEERGHKELAPAHEEEYAEVGYR